MSSVSELLMELTDNWVDPDALGSTLVGEGDPGDLEALRLLLMAEQIQVLKEIRDALKALDFQWDANEHDS